MNSKPAITASSRPRRCAVVGDSTPRPLSRAQITFVSPGAAASKAIREAAARQEDQRRQEERERIARERLALEERMVGLQVA